ncbi:hypothetical protein [Streptomyces gardneri]|uniref:hypothetical protein n=1 Tax=Streptomyces gardneri TaxID=66892 RepID=UPI0035DD09A8
MAPAQAAGGTTVAYTGDSGSTHGGKAIFFGAAAPESFQVCDTKADGMAVRAYFRWNHSLVTIMDDDGSSAFCDNKPGNITRHEVPEGTQVEFKVCRVSAGRDQDCSNEIGRA